MISNGRWDSLRAILIVSGVADGSVSTSCRGSMPSISSCSHVGREPHSSQTKSSDYRAGSALRVEPSSAHITHLEANVVDFLVVESVG